MLELGGRISRSKSTSERKAKDLPYDLMSAFCDIPCTTFLDGEHDLANMASFYRLDEYVPHRRKYIRF